MFDAAQAGLLPAREVARTTPLTTAANGLRYASYGYTEVPFDTLQHLVEAVPPAVARALRERAYYFVPLAIGEAEETEIAQGYTLDLSDRATCHRNVMSGGIECTFVSARLMQDRFALAFEFFINVGHQYVDGGAVPERFGELVWAQARADVRGETSQDAWEARKRALEAQPEPGQEAGHGGIAQAAEALTGGGRDARIFAVPEAEVPVEGAGDRNGRPGEEPGEGKARETWVQHRASFMEAALADTLAIYMLSLSMDIDYADLREREYPLLAAPALADRLRLIAELFPAEAGYEFAIRYRRRH